MRNAYALLGLAFVILLIGATMIERETEDKNAVRPLSEIVLPDVIALDEPIETMSLSLTSPAFSHNGLIPSEYTCDGENLSPEIQIAGVPDEAESLVLVMDDPDIPQAVKDQRGIEKFDHWALYNIPADTTTIPAGSAVGTLGLNSRGESEYTGPCPPDGEHRYIFRLYALPGHLNFIKVPTLDEVEVAAEGSAIARVELIGLYERN